jgi:hypothetical protein
MSDLLFLIPLFSTERLKETKHRETIFFPSLVRQFPQAPQGTAKVRVRVPRNDWNPPLILSTTVHILGITFFPLFDFCMAWMDDNRYTGLAGDQVFTGVNWAWSLVGTDDISEGTTVIQKRQYGWTAIQGSFLALLSTLLLLCTCMQNHVPSRFDSSSDRFTMNGIARDLSHHLVLCPVLSCLIEVCVLILALVVLRYSDEVLSAPLPFAFISGNSTGRPRL